MLEKGRVGPRAGGDLLPVPQCALGLDSGTWDLRAEQSATGPLALVSLGQRNI